MNANYNKPDVRIRVRFLLTEEGGRKSDIATTTYEYGCPIMIDNLYFDCRFRGNEQKYFKPGEWYSINIKFLDAENALPHFLVGKSILLWEGKTIAEGFVEEVLENL